MLVPAISRGCFAVVVRQRGAEAARDAGEGLMSKIKAEQLQSMRKELERMKGKHVSKDLNQKFGLPFHDVKARSRVYENGPSAATSADRSQYPISGMSSPNIADGGSMAPTFGPGGV
jgi:hypothetical protein